MPREHSGDSAEERNISPDLSCDPPPCPVCRNLDPNLAHRKNKHDDTIFSPEPFGFTLGVKVPDTGYSRFPPILAGNVGDVAEGEQEQEEELETVGPLLYEIDKSLLEVEAQARRGCSACNVLFRAFSFSWCTSEELEPDRRLGKGFQEAVQTLYLHAKFSPGTGVLVSITTRSGGYRSVLRTDVLLYQLFALANKPNPWGLIGRLEESPKSLLNERYRRFIQRWIQQCAAEHPYCGALAPRRMPKRLVDVGTGSGDENETIHLEQDLAEPAPYLALSHCWQFSQPLKMTRARLRQPGGTTVKLAELSPTLRDAVRIARWLGVRYIWIDALCIVQDDSADWQAQSAQMGNIYRQAYATIAAHVDTVAPSPAHGCFLEREGFLEIEHPCPGQDGNDGGGGSSNTATTLVRGDFAHAEEAKTAVSLTGRGWCYQERLLASRILHFRPGELALECFAGTTCECEALLPQAGGLPWPRKPYASVKGGFAPYASLAEEEEEKGTEETTAVNQGDASSITDDGEDARKARTAWREIVSNYATTAFTYQTDRQPALASVARRMPRRIFGGYLAGLWRAHLVRDLLWRRTYNEARFRDGGPPPFSSSSSYIAPTFSWASGSGSLSWWHAWGDYGPDPLVLARVLDAECRLAAPDHPFGQVLDGSLRLSGRVAAVRLRFPPLLRLSWLGKRIPRLRGVEWLSKACEKVQWAGIKLRRFALIFQDYPRLHPVRDRVRRFADHFYGRDNDTVARGGVQLLARQDGVFREVPGWESSATVDTEDDAPRLVLAARGLIAIELAVWAPDFARVENDPNARVEVGALLLSPSRRRKGAYDRVAFLEFSRHIGKDKRVRVEDSREENLRRLNDCFDGCEEREVMIV